jgi:hypothetical protein
MKRLLIKPKGNLWPTVIWQGTQLVLFYLSDDDDRVEVRETRGIDFEEFFLHLDKGGSIFVTMKPQDLDIEELSTLRKDEVETIIKEISHQGGGNL